MKKVTVANYRKDKLYPRVVKATARLLQDSDEISPVAILLQMGNLEPKAHDAWRKGQVPYLERVILGNLSKAYRILRIIGYHAHDLNMVPSQRTYSCKNRRGVLRFSKSGDKGVETAYARHYKWNQSQQKKQALVRAALAPAGQRCAMEGARRQGRERGSDAQRPLADSVSGRSG